MFDLLFNFRKAKRHPLELVFVAVFYSSLSILLGSWIFRGVESIAIVFLTLISCLYIIQGAERFEERKEKNSNSERWVLRKHRGIVVMVLSLFVGFMVSFTLWAYLLPQSELLGVFGLQKESVEQIHSLTGRAVFPDFVSVILNNNVRIVFVSLVFALFYGAGAVYILVWNASIMGFVMGSIARAESSIFAIPLVLFKYSLHGIPEMAAYVVAAVAGGILYFSLLNGDLLRRNRVKRILLDVLLLIGISIVLLFFAALIEVYISAWL
jgi:uncharacterized membrane protein SpoIIM required for sporulation